MLTIGIDIGGTFTDVVGIRDGRDVFTAKVPSTPSQLVEGVARGLDKILQISSQSTRDVRRFIHGTTVATNALLEGSGARLGLITTEGFEDILEIGRQIRPREQLYRLDVPAQTPTFLAPRHLRLGVPERIDSEGNTLTPLDEDAVRQAARSLVEEESVEAIAICFLFSFLNPVHEQRARKVIQETYPGLEVSISSEVDPVIREYERLCVTCTDAYIRPVVRRYVSELEDGLRQQGIPAHLQIMQSRGGIAGAENALRRPVALVASGPAAGVLGGIDAARQCGVEDVLTIDIGGTSSDVALVRKGQPTTTRGGLVRGFPLRIATLDVNSIGAGGGSIAWLDSAGGLRVGPRSAGSVPGPVCYGQGGTAPTVTDASLLLGYLNASYFAGGDFELNVAEAEKAVTELGESLGLGVVETALGIHRVVNANMADQIRLRSVGRGQDPRRFALVVLGGAGPVHGAAVADHLGISSIIVPNTPGVLSAYGLLVASVEHERVATFARETRSATVDEVEGLLGKLREQTVALMSKEDIDMEGILVERSADMRYVGQSHELEVPLPTSDAENLIRDAEEAFLEAHERVYRHRSFDAPIEFVNLRVTVRSPLPHPQPRTSMGRGTDPSDNGQRIAYFHGYEQGVHTGIFRRSDLGIGTELNGPVIVEQADTTTVVPPSWKIEVTPRGELLMRSISDRNIPK